MLSVSTLTSQLDTQVSNSITEPPARTAWALAWTNYFYAATSMAISIPSGALASAQSALETGLTGFSVSGQGAIKIQSGLIAFWGILSATPAAIFAGSIVITPPGGLAGLPAALASVFVTNTAPGITKTQALTNIATVLHTNAGLGGTSTFPGPIIQPIV